MSRTIAVALALAVILPATARAATYDVQLCADRQAMEFVPRNDDPAALLLTASCPPAEGDPESGIYVGVLPSTATATRGTLAGWTLTAPAGTTFAAVDARRRLRKTDRSYEIAVVKADGTITDGCHAGDLCEEAVATHSYGGTRQLTFQVRCAAAACGNSTQGSRAWLRLESVRATIDDPAPPVVLPPATSGPWQRTAQVTARASDASGIAGLALRKGDQTLGTVSLGCDYRHLQPCPGTAAATIAIDLPDGSHALTAQATDAARQSATSGVTTLNLDRMPPASPQALTVRPTGTGTYVYAWTNPDQGNMAPIAAARLSDGTVVRGANLQQLESASPFERVYLEDEAGNADPATAVGSASSTPVRLQRPILQPATAPKIKVTSTKREGTRLLVRGSVANATSAQVSATVTRGARSARGSVRLSQGRFTIRIALSATLRRTGTVTLTVRHGTAKATRRVQL